MNLQANRQPPYLSDHQSPIGYSLSHEDLVLQVPFIEEDDDTSHFTPAYHQHMGATNSFGVIGLAHRPMVGVPHRWAKHIRERHADQNLFAS